ncbi:MAG: GNAT family N-acetyltransferase [Cyanomargarita calcarea GSE-NOS-MK-12-04C]|jgi:GNAT superfamily N-acetyltransferase|uniref:GNAT family N-acetyltransferase n=1 Tax=Cyanomargarita calcarea GSE-NOS-MK-12-04C TaxID=2839659 RepID=A0A951QJQ1_9CYAN|nr:GNAT family N-acetyltransferase [Cyanomargarita calcarea GSE-NOS-MK-12-04C]
MVTRIRLNRGTDNVPVEASIVNLNNKHVEDFENIWMGLLRLYQQDDKFWDLETKLLMISSYHSYEGYAVECNDQTEGVLLLETQLHGSQITPGKRIVYIYYVATAPWNREAIQRPPKLQGIGTALLLFAISRSLELGYEGRVGLHSLPGYEKFYDNRGMLDLGSDSDYENLVYFEYGVWQQRQQEADESQYE